MELLRKFLLSTYYALRLDHNNEFIKSIRKVFDQRNALVHPKTKEIDFKNIENYAYIHPGNLELNNAFNTLEMFIDDFCNKDPDIDRNFHFQKP